MSPYIFIALSTIFGISGQLSLKHGMGKAGKAGGSPIKAFLSPWVIGGLGVYGFGVIFWLLALSHLELSYAYPFASLSYVGIIMGSFLLFKERITWMRVVGISVIITGVLIIGLEGLFR